MKRWFVWSAAAVVVLIAAVWVLHVWLAGKAKFEYSGTLETREIQVGSKVGGRVIEVPVEEGQVVKSGALLVRFECDELKAQRAQSAATVAQAVADLDRMQKGNRPEEIEEAVAGAKVQRATYDAARNGPRQQEIAQAKADYAAALSDAANAETFFHRMEKLLEAEAISRQQFDDATNKRDSSAQKAESLRQHLSELQAGTRVEDLQAAEARARQADAAAALSRKGFRKEDIDAARGRLAQAEAQVAELDVRLKEAELRAPVDAVIEVVSIRPGDLVSPGKIVETLLEPSQLWVRVYIPESELALVRLGQKATVRVDGLPGRDFVGTVEQIASQAEFLPRNVQTRDDREHQVFGAKVYVDHPDGILKSGMSATVRLQ